MFSLRRNPRFVGQVFRRGLPPVPSDDMVVIPDLWGKFSDLRLWSVRLRFRVVIPDLWGKFSDLTMSDIQFNFSSRNPRFVGQVFRRITHA